MYLHFTQNPPKDAPKTAAVWRLDENKMKSLDLFYIALTFKAANENLSKAIC